METLKVITHGGFKAHFDEVLAIIEIMMCKPDCQINIFRHDPSEQDLNDPTIWVLDCGERHDPLLHNFDHHQLPNNTEYLCSASLVAQYFGMLEDMRDCFPWYKNVEIRDNIGIDQIAKRYGLKRENYLDIQDPIGGLLLQQIGKYENQEPVPDYIIHILFDIAADLKRSLMKYKPMLATVKTQSEIHQIDSLKVIWLPLSNVTPDISKAVSRFRNECHPAIKVSIVKDFRGPGWCMFRFGEGGIDFSKIENDPLIEWASPKGYLAKTKEQISWKDLKRLVEKSLI